MRVLTLLLLLSTNLKVGAQLLHLSLNFTGIDYQKSQRNLINGNDFVNSNQKYLTPFLEAGFLNKNKKVLFLFGLGYTPNTSEGNQRILQSKSNYYWKNPTYFVRAGLSKKILDGKLSARLNSYFSFKYMPNYIITQNNNYYSNTNQDTLLQSSQSTIDFPSAFELGFYVSPAINYKIYKNCSIKLEQSFGLKVNYSNGIYKENRSFFDSRNNTTVTNNESSNYKKLTSSFDSIFILGLIYEFPARAKEKIDSN